MNKDLEVFENRQDDWLAKERKYEESVSAWDFDEGKRIKEFHEKNCAAERLEKEHEIKHATYNKLYGKGVIGKNSDFETVDLKKVAFILAIIPIIIFFAAMVMVLEERGIASTSIIGYILPLFVFVILFTKAKGKRRH